MPGDHRRTLAIGLDGFEPSIAERLLAAGEMPALAALQRSGASLLLDHSAERRTGLAWEHFSTGLTPNDARRWSAVDFDPQRYACTQRGTRTHSLFDHLDGKTMIFDLPYCDLDLSVRLEGVTGWGVHDPGAPPRSRPHALLNEVEQRFGTYPAPEWIYGFTWPDPDATEQMGRDLVRAVSTRAAIGRWLFGERLRDWDLAVMVVSELHSVLEPLWHGVDPDHPLAGEASASAAKRGVEAVYRAIDALIGEMRAALPDTLLVVFSLHGMGSNHADVTSMALLPELLYRRATGDRRLVAARRDHRRGRRGPLPDPGAAWHEHVRRRYRDPDTSALRRLVREQSRATLRRLPPAIREALRRMRRHARGPGAQPPSPETLPWMPASWYADAWPVMDAFALPAFYDGQIRINLEGREARGVVAVRDYQATLDAVERDLRAVTDFYTGQPVVGEILRLAGDSDPRELAPSQADLVVVWQDTNLGIRHPRFGTVGPLPYRRTGGHTGGKGMAVFSDPAIAAGEYGERHALDLPPTLVEAMGERPRGLSGSSFWSSLHPVPETGTLAR